MKPHAKTSRYMSLPHRSEYLDDLLEYFADLKYENIAELTCQVTIETKCAGFWQVWILWGTSFMYVLRFIH